MRFLCGEMAGQNIPSCTWIIYGRKVFELEICMEYDSLCRCTGKVKCVVKMGTEMCARIAIAASTIKLPSIERKVGK